MGADVTDDGTRWDDRALVEHAIWRSNFDVLDKFLELGASPDQIGCMSGAPIILGCDDPDAIKILLDRGADWTAKDDFGNTVLHAIAEANFFLTELTPASMIRRLLELGLDIDAQNAAGDSPLRHCILHDDYRFIEGTPVVQALLAQGADPRVANRQGLSSFDAIRGKGWNADFAGSLIDQLSEAASLLDRAAIAKATGVEPDSRSPRTNRSKSL